MNYFKTFALMVALTVLLMLVGGVIAATIIQLAISRQREYAADKGGAVLCDNPLYLANALKKLDYMNKAVPMPAAPLSQSTAHMFVVNPFRSGTFKSLFSTHPPTEKRIEQLIKLAQGGAE